MEGYNGYARPLDGLVRQRGYRLYNINNLKLARFKEIFPDRFHGTYPPNFNEGTHLISRKGPTQFQVVPFIF
jgi:hypothetical protein